MEAINEDESSLKDKFTLILSKYSNDTITISFVGTEMDTQGPETKNSDIQF
ncbi:MAG: hypothetical protein ACK5HR_00345 [Mycoplasmatales bacterium]